MTAYFEVKDKNHVGKPQSFWTGFSASDRVKLHRNASQINYPRLLKITQTLKLNEASESLKTPRARGKYSPNADVLSDRFKSRTRCHFQNTASTPRACGFFVL